MYLTIQQKFNIRNKHFKILLTIKIQVHQSMKELFTIMKIKQI